jgi:hypothetical protein
MTTAIPAVKPVVTGWGMNWISRPMRSAPMPSRISPASIVASSRPAIPSRAAIGASTTTNAAVGPETLCREPPRSAMTAPPTMAVYSPCCGGTPACDGQRHRQRQGHDAHHQSCGQVGAQVGGGVARGPALAQRGGQPQRRALRLGGLVVAMRHPGAVPSTSQRSSKSSCSLQCASASGVNGVSL